MADAAPKTVDGEKKKRKPQGPRMPRKLFAVLGIDNGAPVVLKASYDAAGLISTFAEATTAGKQPVFADVTPTK
jgi:hypothetical protein